MSHKCCKESRGVYTSSKLRFYLQRLPPMLSSVLHCESCQYMPLAQQCQKYEY